METETANSSILLQNDSQETPKEETPQVDLTFRVLCVLSATAAVWEMWTIANNRRGDTFSATIKKLATNQPFIVLMTGLVCGHLFWPLRDGED